MNASARGFRQPRSLSEFRLMRIARKDFLEFPVALEELSKFNKGGNALTGVWLGSTEGKGGKANAVIINYTDRVGKAHEENARLGGWRKKRFRAAAVSLGVREDEFVKNILGLELVRRGALCGEFAGKITDDFMGQFNRFSRKLWKKVAIAVVLVAAVATYALTGGFKSLCARINGALLDESKAAIAVLDNRLEETHSNGKSGKKALRKPEIANFELTTRGGKIRGTFSTNIMSTGALSCAGGEWTIADAEMETSGENIGHLIMKKEHDITLPGITPGEENSCTAYAGSEEGGRSQQTKKITAQ